MSLYTPFTSQKGKWSLPQKRMSGKHLCQKNESFQMNRKAGENSRYEQTRKPLGQKPKTVGKLGGDV